MEWIIFGIIMFLCISSIDGPKPNTRPVEREYFDAMFSRMKLMDMVKKLTRRSHDS